MDKKNKTKKFNVMKVLVVILEFVAVGLIVYLIFLPFYPNIKYAVKEKAWGRLAISQDKEIAVEDRVSGFPEAEYAQYEEYQNTHS